MASSFNYIEAAELIQKVEADENILVIDVRESGQYRAANIGGMNVPLSRLQGSLVTLNKHRKKKVVLVCMSRNMNRVKQAFVTLKKARFTDLSILKGGIFPVLNTQGRTFKVRVE